MSSRYAHINGDCWWPCPYCAEEDQLDEAANDDDVEDDGSEQ